MEIPKYTEGDIEEMKKIIPFKLPKNKEYIYENFVMIQRCFGEMALNDAILQIKKRYNIE